MRTFKVDFVVKVQKELGYGSWLGNDCVSHRYKGWNMDLGHRHSHHWEYSFQGTFTQLNLPAVSPNAYAAS